MSRPSWRGWAPGIGIRFAELPGQVRDARLQSFDLLAQGSQLGGLPPSRGLGLAQLGSEFGYLTGQVVHRCDPLGNVSGRGTHVHALARVPDNQPIRPELGHRSPDNRHRDAVYLAQSSRGRNGRPHRKLTRGDLPPQVVGDLLVRGTPGGFGHLAILRHAVPVWPLLRQAAPNPAPPHANLIHKAKQGVLACCGPQRTSLDAYALAVITGEPPRASVWSAEAGSMQRISNPIRKYPWRSARERAHAHKK